LKINFVKKQYFNQSDYNTTNTTNTTYKDPDRPNNTDPAYDFSNNTLVDVNITLQGDDNIYLEYTADFNKYVFVGST